MKVKSPVILVFWCQMLMSASGPLHSDTAPLTDQSGLVSDEHRDKQLSHRAGALFSAELAMILTEKGHRYYSVCGNLDMLMLICIQLGISHKHNCCYSACDWPECQ